MAGHSQFKNIMHRKGAQDAKKAKIFTRLTREITVAAKISPELESNPRLRTAIQAAKAANLPKDRIATAIAKASSNMELDNYEEVRYEGYGTAGVAIIVEALTDNRNRTASEIRSSFTKFGGNLGETGSVSFMFTRLGCVTYPLNIATFEQMFDATIEAGGQDCQLNDDTHEIFCDPDDLNKVRDFFEDKFGTANSATLIWKPNTIQKLTLEESEKLMKMLDALDECDDVQNVIGNFELLNELH